jgi:hypothetical protein
VPLTREPIVLSGDAVGDPAIETIELLHSALIELEPGAEEHDLMRSIEWEEKRVSFPATRSAHLAVQAQTVIDIGKDTLRRQDATEAVSVENLYVVLDDVRSLSTDPQEIEAIDSLLAAVRSWVRCHPTSKAHHERARSICEDALRMKRAFDSGESHNNQEMVIVKVIGELSTWSDFETEIASAHHLLGLLAKLWPEPTPTMK